MEYDDMTEEETAIWQATFETQLTYGFSGQITPAMFAADEAVKAHRAAQVTA